MDTSRRIAVIGLGILAAIVLVVVVALFVISSTEWGREQVRRGAVSRLQAAINGEVEIGRMEGNLLSGVRLIDVSIVDSAGRPFVRADTLSTRYSLRGLLRKRISLDDLRFVGAEVVLDRSPGEEWNFQRIFVSEAAGDMTTSAWGEWVELHDITLVSSRLTMRTEWKPPPDLSPAEQREAIREVLAGESRANVVEVPGGYRNVMDFRELNAAIDRVLVAHPDTASIPIDVDRFSGILEPFNPPAADVRDLSGHFRLRGDTLYFTDIVAVLPDSRMSANGFYAMEYSELVLSADGSPVALADLQWLYPALPEQGGGSLEIEYTMEPLSHRIVARDMDLRIGESELKGGADILLGDAVRIRGTDLRFAQFDTRLIESLAPDLALPRRGRLSGRLSLDGSPTDMRLEGDVAFDDDKGGTSRIVAAGRVAAADKVRLHGLQVQFQPLQAELLRAVSPDLPLRGTIEGRANVTGVVGDRMQIESNLVMRDPQTGLSRVSAEGGLVFGETMRLDDLHMQLDPLQLDLLRQYAPNVPPGATASGPVRLDGSLDAMLQIDGDLTFDDPASGVSRVSADGAVDLGGEMAFESIDLRFDPLRLELVRFVQPDFPLGGTIEGDATVSGSPSTRLDFVADLVHAEADERSHVTGKGTIGMGPGGDLNLDLQVQPLSLRTVGRFAPQAGLRGEVEGAVDVSGTLDDLLVDADLRVGDGGSINVGGRLDLTSTETAYQLTAALENFDPSAVSGRTPVVTSLSGTAQVEGRGFDPATMDASLRADFKGVEVEDYEANEIRLQLDVADGMAVVSPSMVRLRSAEAQIEGNFGLVSGREGQLAYRLRVDSLDTFEPLLPAPADTGVVRPRPAIRQEALRAAERARRDAEVEFLATGSLPEAQPAGAAPVITTIRHDSLAGSVEASGMIRGNLNRFDADGNAVVDEFIYLGHYVESGEINFTLADVGSAELNAAVDANLGPMVLAGYAFDGAVVDATYVGGRYGAGEIEVEIEQDEATKLQLDAAFLLSLERNELRIRDMALLMDTVAWNATSTAGVYWGGAGVRVDRLELQSDAGARVFIDGDLPVEGPANLEVAVTDFEIGQLFDLLQDDREASGLLSLDARVQGSSQSPQIEGEAALLEASVGGDALPDVRAVFEYMDEELVASADLVQEGVGTADVQAQIPINLTLGNGGPGLLDRPMQIDMQAERLTLDALPVFTRQVQSVDGTIDANVSITGTPRNPVIEGDVSLAMETLYFVPLGISFEPIVGHASASGGVLQIDSLVAWSDGPVRITGSIDLESLTMPEFDLEVEAQETWVIDTDDANLQVDADLTIVGPFDALEVNGLVRTRRGVIYVPELSEFGSANIVNLDDPAIFERTDTLLFAQREFATERSPIIENLQADFEVAIDRDVWLRSTEANVEIYTPSEIGPLHIGMSGLQGQPTIEGTINTDRGEYEYLSRRFTLTRGGVTFLGSEEINPLLQLAAEHEVALPGREALTIRIVVGGSMRDLQITLESDAQPPISQTDLLGFLAFGREASTLIQGQGSSISGQSASGSGLVGNVAGVATQQFTAIALDAMVRGLEADIARDLGLDVFRITPASVPADIFSGSYVNVLRGTEMEAGVYLGPRLFVAAQARPTRSYPGIRLEYRTRRDFEWSASWSPRYVPIVPTLREPRAEQVGVFGSFLFKEWRF